MTPEPDFYAGERPEDAAQRFAGIRAAHTIDGLEAIRQQWAAAMEELAKAKERIAELESALDATMPLERKLADANYWVAELREGLSASERDLTAARARIAALEAERDRWRAGAQRLYTALWKLGEWAADATPRELMNESTAALEEWEVAHGIARASLAAAPQEETSP